jgi:hypothetical protein
MRRGASDIRDIIGEAMGRLNDPGLRGEDLEAEIRRGQGLANLAKQYVADRNAEANMRNAETEKMKTVLRAYELAEEFEKPAILKDIGPVRAIEAGTADDGD